ncbi:hypothetical protein E5A73_09995 [Sphingomonas gei]|uniref:Uncharacterized protein n=2 Tax=Sphingomonas gei TaxID=1395960 RepID=A0A4S1XDF9_9SPHN|nr:hypothetical protein E5A73_09995 [Sphingomonas gei]
MTHLAKDFAISDVALHKISRKHDVPTPPPGWWAKKAAGKNVKQTPLPKAKVGSEDKITIAGGELSQEQPSIAAVREQARILATGEKLDAAPHPIVERTLAKLRKAKPSPIGIVSVAGPGLIKCEVAPETIDRLGAILSQIVQAAAMQGFSLIDGEPSARFRDEAESVGFAISELTKREKHILTEAEQAKEEAWLLKRERASKADSWRTYSFDRPRFPEWDYRPTGQLSFEFEQVCFWGGSPRRSYRDAKIQRLENMTADIAVGLAVFAAAKTEDKLRRAAEQQRVEEVLRLRQLEARAKHVEERRTSALGAILGELQELDRLRELMALLAKQAPVNPAPRVAGFLDWATDHLAMREARLSAPSLEERFTGERLFGDTDDFGFQVRRY